MSVSQNWALNKQNVQKSIRELDAHDLSEDDSCDVGGCDGHATHAMSGATIGGWVCERHVEQSPLIAQCAVCGALIIGRCADDHSTPQTQEHPYCPDEDGRCLYAHEVCPGIERWELCDA